MTTSDHRSKRATGLPGFDNATNGGLPSAGATLLVGSPGTGKTNLGLQIAAQAAERNEPTVFISFEETTEGLTANAASFDWGHTLANNPHLHLLDARPPTNAASSGSFDVEALLNVVPTLTEPDQPIWLVLDGIDQLLAYEHDTSTAVQQIRNIQEWSLRNNVTTIVTGKPPSPRLAGTDYVEAAKYALPTVIELTAKLERRHLIRRLRILKYRGSAHTTNEIPIILDGAGFHLPYHVYTPTRQQPASYQRMSTGIPRLDDILGGGVYVGSTTLISGAPGTAKTNLALHFAAEAAKRGERALFVSYDEPAEVIIRDATSIGLDLQPYVDAHTLTFHAVPAWTSIPEAHVLALQNLIQEMRPKVLVIDPVSALFKTTESDNAYLSIQQVLYTTRANGVTTVLTSLLQHGASRADEAVTLTSTLADTWIALDYSIIGGERNRALSIVKSRGTRHSNQVRELLLSSEGIDLADVYDLGSEVLMGTARLFAENQEADQQRRALRERRQKRRGLESQLEATEARLQELTAEQSRLQDSLRADADDDAEADRQAVSQLETIVHERRPGQGRATRPDEHPVEPSDGT